MHNPKQCLVRYLFGIMSCFNLKYINFRPISDIDLPELPDFLRPDPSTPRPIRPIQDIDLPDGASVIQPDEDSEIIENKPVKIFCT